jgi:signal transduction histidine kinase/DNA-binding response OmpR family regulator
MTATEARTAAGGDATRHARVRADLRRLLQARVLRETSGFALFGHPALMVLVILLTWEDVPHSVAIGWGLAVTLATGLRAWWMASLPRRDLTDAQVRLGVRVTVALLGFCWGMGAGLALRYLPFTNIALVLAVLAGIIAASLATLSADPTSFYAFLGAIIGPTFFAVLANGQDRLHLLTVAIVAFYAGALVIVYRRAHDALIEHLQTTALLVSSEEAAKAAEQVMREARDLAERTAAARSAFLANMSHEIRTPMNAVLGFVELVLDTELANEQRRALELVRSSSEALLTILNDILDYSKIEADHLELEAIPFDLHKLVHATASLLAVRAREKHLELLADVSPAVPRMVRGDPTRLRQVLTNLVGNAIKFTEAGEVVITTTLDGSAAGLARVHFRVRDTGIGIAPDQLSVIFKEFSQADASMTRRYGGTGLGLAISQKLVDLMGGRLSVTSEPGRGSEFFFTIALPVEAAQETHAAARASLGGRRVLVVDDNETNRRILRDVLAAEGIAVSEAMNAGAGLEALRRAAATGAPYDLTILDAQMPDQDGFELAGAVRADPVLAHARLLMLTSAGQRGDGERCRELGIQAYLTKPVSRGDLVEALGVVLAGPVGPGAPDVVTRHTIAESRRTLRVLLAEDNLVNQQVAVAMLVKRGHTIDAVSNGREAVEAVRQRSYDVVLMDIQMPEMDGFEATAAIRALPGGGGIPIIALTAHALSGERENCLARGMTGYLAKPFKSHELFALVEGSSDRARPTPVPEAAEAPPPVDLEAFRNTLREAGAEEAVDSILDTFSRQAPDRIATLVAAVAGRQAADTVRAAHTLRGAAGTIGANRLAEILERIEEIARQGDVSDLRDDVQRAEVEAAAVLDHLRRRRAPKGVGAGAPR